MSQLGTDAPRCSQSRAAVDASGNVRVGVAESRRWFARSPRGVPREPMAGATHAPEGRSRYENDPLVGTVLNGKFQVHAVIANGGMGRIYRGEQIPLGRPVAIKVLHSKYTSSSEDPAFQKRFFLEASILSKLQHPNIVTVFDYGHIEGLDDESYFLAMEYLAGETLHRRLRTLGALPPVEAIGIIRQMARGLREAHRQGVVHRDLKPSNIMLVPEDAGHELVKIIDFGLVKVLTDESEELTKEGSFLGSPRYMSPEQIAHGKVDHRTDVYSLGVILYQCLCGRTPFENENSVHTLMAHLQHPVPPMRERNPAVEVPEVLEQFARRCLEKNPINRPATMEEFLRGLRECEATLGILTASAANTAASGHFAAMGNAAGPITNDPSLTSAPHTGSGARLTPPVAAMTSSPAMPSAPMASAPVPSAAFPAAAPEAPKSRALPLALGAIVVLGCIVVALLVLRTPAAPPPPASTANAPAAPLREYRLVIDSSTPGAQVWEGESLLGAAPLTLIIQNDTVRTAPRRLQVRLDGYEPFAVNAAPSEEAAVRVVATLVPRPAQGPAAAPDAAPIDPTVNVPAVNAPPRRSIVGRPPIRVPQPTPHSNPAHHDPGNDDLRIHR